MKKIGYTDNLIIHKNVFLRFQSDPEAEKKYIQENTTIFIERTDIQNLEIRLKFNEVQRNVTPNPQFYLGIWFTDRFGNIENHLQSFRFLDSTDNMVEFDPRRKFELDDIISVGFSTKYADVDLSVEIFNINEDSEDAESVFFN